MFGAGRLLSTVGRAVETRRYAKIYSGLHDNLDVETHLREAAGWIARAQDAGPDAGVAYGARFGKSFLPSYPETTGYIVPIVLRLGRVWNDVSLHERAVRMGDWEIDVQMPCGAVMGGMVTEPPTPAVFNTGQVLLGWAALARETGAGRFLDAARRAAEWLVGVQEADGNWREGNSRFAHAGATVYNVRAAWGLYEVGELAGEDRFRQAALRNAAFALSRQAANGWFSDCCLSEPARPLLHTIAYTMEGLLEIGLLRRDAGMIAAARRTADALVAILGPDGYLPGRLRPDFSAAATWCCLTGSAQTSIVLSRLATCTGEGRYRDAARRINRYLMARHDISSADPAIRGGLAGSWPVDGDYGRLMILNWATAFLIDALLWEREASC
ncbi:MAG TPA: hypothetical protein VMF70_07595 [Gemmatimonadales bacterium]|nr:hypothetical protein [Gemmatimonadales bacterium]